MTLLAGTLLAACSGSNAPPPAQAEAGASAPGAKPANPARPLQHGAFAARPPVAGPHDGVAPATSVDAIFPRLDQRFTDADTNHDGYVSREEAQAAAPMMARNFDQIDTDHDGRLSREEVRAFLEKRFVARQGAAGQAGAAASAPPQK